jgi:hypothetical protein
VFCCDELEIFHKLIIFSLLHPNEPPLQIISHREKEEMVSRSPPPSKWGRRKDDDDESRSQKKSEKGKEPTAKDADEEPLYNDTKFVVELLWSPFKKLEGVKDRYGEPERGQ